MQIFNKVAGFSLGESDIIRRAMAKKKLKILTDPKTNYHGKFIDGLVANGAAAAEAEDYWEQLLDFASYAFNKSHAAAYAHISYYTAWLKYHYPAEYMCSVLTRSDFKKLPTLINDCRKMGLAIEPPDINRSMDGFSNTSRSILFGFGSIKGIGNSGPSIVQEREKGLFSSVKDFVTRMLVSCPKDYKKSVMESLINSGAMDSFCGGNRASLLNSIEDFATITKNMLKKEVTVRERQAAFDALKTSGASEADIKKAERSLLTAQKGLAAQQELYTQHAFPMVIENSKEKLDNEYALLGVYLSGNPFEGYVSAAKKVDHRYDIADAFDMDGGTKVTVCGIVKDLLVLQRNSDGKPFCAFTLYDMSAEIPVKCFTAMYEKFGNLVANGTALTVKGTVRRDTKILDDGTEADYGAYLTVSEIAVLEAEHKGAILLTGDDLSAWAENQDAVMAFKSNSGYNAYFIDKSLGGKARKVSVMLSADILRAKFNGLLVSKTNFDIA